MSKKSLAEYVSLDVETTGLSPQFDDVIEVAVVVFNEREEISRYSQLVRPKKPISLQISRLTGITQEMLNESPRFSEIVEDLADAIGDRPIVGHNISFDMGMLAGEGFTPDNRLVDTYTLATGMIVDIPNYQLGTIAEHFGYTISEADRHRALGDTVATVHVFQKMLEMLGSYDVVTLRQISQFAKAAKWKEAWFFEELARNMVDAPLFDPARPQTVPPELAFMAPRERPEPLRPTGNQDPIDTSIISDLLGSGGGMEQVLENFRHRPTQLTMANQVAAALSGDNNLLIEAGTGTGKSLAYLLPAAIFAVQRGERIVVSTATIALQDQLHHKDLPDVRVALQEAGISQELKVAVMKGRQNYLCLKQWFNHKDDAIEDEHDASLRAKIMLWLNQTETGDKGELRLSHEEDRYWRKYASERGRCTPGRCQYASSNQCFFHRARWNAQSAHIIIANHSLVLVNADEGRVLPAFDRLILDEAHHLEDEATRQMSFSLTREALEDTLKFMIKIDSGNISGAIPSATAALARGGEQFEKQYGDQMRAHAKKVEQAAIKINLLAGELFQRVGAFLGKPKGNNGYSESIRVTEHRRDSDPFIQICLMWEELRPEVRTIVESGEWLKQALEDMPVPSDPGNPLLAIVDEASADLMVGIDEVYDVYVQLEQTFNPTPDVARDQVFWIQRSSQQQQLSINGAPLDVSDLLNQKVYANLRSVVMTSATMTIDGSFDYIAEHVGMEGSKVLDLGSPFNHRQSTLLYVADDMPEPSHPSYTPALHDALFHAVLATKGRTLVLFTSHKALREARSAIKDSLAQHNILVLGQGVDGNSRALVDRLRNDPGTVVFGTSTFWEGVDVVGDALSSLIITKFPFAVPTDPIFEARSELYENPFMELSLPMAVLKFKQGFGRLIRTENDRGICVILDKRAVSKRYGSMFVQSLPPANLHHGSLYDLPEAASNWVRPVDSTPA